jgi:peptidoglycan/xylan/chitin deacetylase (PgdA/CDA1 family)
LLRDERFCCLPLEHLMEAVRNRRPLPKRTVCFTVDDGYEDFAAVGAPIFARFEMPVTMFVPTGFLDGETWLWWDLLDAATSARGSGRHVSVDGTPWTLTWHSEPERRRRTHELAKHLERLPTDRREAVVGEVLSQLGFQPPSHPLSDYRPMSWDQARALEANGVRFAPHTVTHPILSLCNEARADHEIRQSWARLGEELHDPLPVLAYPNGSEFACGNREMQLAARAGLAGAVTMRNTFVKGPFADDAPYRIPRVTPPEDPLRFLQLVGGQEHFRQRLRFA